MPIVIQINTYRGSSEEFYLQRCLTLKEVDDIKDIIDSYPNKYDIRDEIYLYLRNRDLLYNEITFKYKFIQKGCK